MKKMWVGAVPPTSRTQKWKKVVFKYMKQLAVSMGVTLAIHPEG
jgi:hypothetical protein